MIQVHNQRLFGCIDQVHSAGAPTQTLYGGMNSERYKWLDNVWFGYELNTLKE